MLILTSNGISNDDLFIKVKQIVNKNLKVAALVTTASEHHEERDRNIQRHTEILGQLGLEVEVFDIAEQDPSLLEKYDLIFIMGGNPFYLLDIMRKTNCKKLFAKYIKDKVVIGASAGSLVFGSTLGFIYELEPELNNAVKLTDFTGLCLTTVHIFPHASRLINVFERCVERLNNFAQQNNLQIVFVEDGQAVFVDEIVNRVI